MEQESKKYKAVIFLAGTLTFLLSDQRLAFAASSFEQVDYVWAAALISILPLMMILTFMAGGYKIIESKAAENPSLSKWKSWNQTLVVLGAIAYIAATPIYLVPGRTPEITIGWLVLCAVPITRGIYLVSWGLQANGGSGSDQLKHATPWRLMTFGGILLCASLSASVIPWWVAEVSYAPFSTPREKIYLPQNHLRHFHLGCQAYWHENGRNKVCDLKIVLKPEIGLVQNEQVEMAGHGTKEDFSATAKHVHADTVYVIDSDGNIREKK